ncbi:MAG: hypothetical protein KatS3mg023_3668 [Armatimonadota bacterium]|nr:MAG: hypothetical protein KatS3mg023_3668 [Armatimonadota bacterium]
MRQDFTDRLATALGLNTVPVWTLSFDEYVNMLRLMTGGAVELRYEQIGESLFAVYYIIIEFPQYRLSVVYREPVFATGDNCDYVEYWKLEQIEGLDGVRLQCETLWRNGVKVLEKSCPIDAEFCLN